MKVTAATTIYNSEFELTDIVAIEKTGTASVPAPIEVTTITDASQGQLVQLKDVTIENIISATPVGSFEFDAGSSRWHEHTYPCRYPYRCDGDFLPLCCW
ncbi:hypothetical protein Q0F98_23200 [Paenibacillus amylolyticus]|nr:hypothetical protein Q0F98_23200 [Paenibacillus amylolyticus]